MTIVTESELREYWQSGHGQLPAFSSDTRFTDSAREFLRQHKIDVQTPVGIHESSHTHPEWDKPGTFPVVLTGPVPVCVVCGQPIKHKPDHMTQLDAGHYASKTDLRLVLRGRVDSLHAFVMLAAVKARGFQMVNLGSHLDTLAAYCREILSAEYNLRPVAPLILLGKREEELHEISHWPDRHLGIQHIVPGPEDHEMLHWLNVLRTQAREVEVIALEAFGADQGLNLNGIGNNLSHAFNRFSSAVYVLELYFKAGKL
jgi:ethanolamine utilization cobalamin adenosyltransferase